jgi:hypothetical protein
MEDERSGAAAGGGMVLRSWRQRDARGERIASAEATDA